MPIVAKWGDRCGGAMQAGLQSHAKINGLAVIVVGDVVQNHGLPPHFAAIMVEGSSVVNINGIPIVRTGDAASCGHTAIGTTHVEAS